MQKHRYDTEAHTDLGNNLSYLELKNKFAALFPFSLPHLLKPLVFQLLTLKEICTYITADWNHLEIISQAHY